MGLGLNRYINVQGEIMNSNELLDALKKQLGVESDYALARLLKISRPALSDWRTRGLSDERALQFATDLGINPGPVLAAIHAERSADPKVRKAWETIAKTIRSAAAAVLVVLGMGVTAPEPLQASQQVSPGIHYAKYMNLLCGTSRFRPANPKYPKFLRAQYPASCALAIRKSVNDRLLNEQHKVADWRRRLSRAYFRPLARYNQT